MTTQSTKVEHHGGRDRMPVSVRYAVFGVLGMLLAGALYLISVRGEALLVDLTGLSGRIFCF